MNEASSRETPYGRMITSGDWFVLNLAEALAVRNEEKGGVVYPLESREASFGDFGVNVHVLWPGEPNALYHVSEVAARYGASAAKETYDPDEAYADWPGDYQPARVPWPVADG